MKLSSAWNWLARKQYAARRRPLGADLRIESLEDRITPSLTIQFDFSRDTNGFFNDPARVAVLQAAAHSIVARFTDSLSAITPDPANGNTWQLQTSDPGNTAQNIIIDNLSIPADTILVFAGGQDLSVLGQGGPGGFSVSGDAAWVDTVSARGQAGAGNATPTDFGPWGGSLSFDVGFDRWYFGSDPSAIPADGVDFFSVAEHELGHLLGFGTAASWGALATANSLFTGAAASARFGGSVPTDAPAPNAGHWQDGVTDQGQPTTMDPIAENGARTSFTELDFAGFADLGWQLTPAVPVMIAPSGSLANGTPTFVWTSLTGAASYTLVVDNLTTAQNGVISQANLTNVVFTPGTALPGGSYRARVQAFDATSTAINGFSGPINFSVAWPSTTTVGSVPAVTFSSSAQTVNLTATVTSTGGTVNQGTVTFALFDGATPVGTATTSTTVSSGNASVNYTLPAGTPVGSYSIRATYNPGADFTGSTDFSQSLTVNPAGPNNAPSLSNVPASVSISEQALLTFTATASDADAGQTLTFSLIGAPSGASISPSTGIFTWTPTESQGPGSFPFTVRVSDGTANTDASITVSVTEANLPPALSAVPTSFIAVRGFPITFDADATDADLLNGQPNTLTFSLVDAPSGATIDPDSGVFTWSPDESLPLGNLSFSVVVTDNGPGSLNATQNVDVELAAIALHDGDLLVSGTPGNDVITVKLFSADPTRTDVVLNGTSLGQVDLTSITGKISVHGFSGSDRITIVPTITKNAELIGGAGNDTLIGGSGNDSLDGGAGNDLLSGRKGDDTYRLADSWGADRIVEAPASGSDRMDFSAATADVTFTLNGSVIARHGTNVAVGVVEGIVGGAGNDTFRFSDGKGVSGTIDGGGGTNTLSYAAYTTRVKVNLLLGTATRTGGIGNIANVSGGRNRDILVGDAAVNVLLGNGGRDILIGGEGADILNGGGADDILVGGVTDNDSNPANLEAMMIAWARALPYATRIINLTSLLSDSSVVHDDGGAEDALTGGLGLDWFLTSLGDVITDPSNGGTETETVV